MVGEGGGVKGNYSHGFLPPKIKKTRIQILVLNCTFVQIYRLLKFVYKYVRTQQ